jgi:serine/threonine protein kinase
VKKLKKTFSPKVAEKEVAVMKRLPLNNKNVIRFYGTYRENNRLVIVTEFVKNGRFKISITN